MIARRPQGACPPHPLPTPVGPHVGRRPEGAALLLLPVLEQVERALVEAHPHLAEPDDDSAGPAPQPAARAAEDLVLLVLALRDSIAGYHASRSARPATPARS